MKGPKDEPVPDNCGEDFIVPGENGEESDGSYWIDRYDGLED
jgi:hypothetical protein